MSIKSNNTMKAAISMALLSGTLGVAATAVAGENPFAINELPSGYQLAEGDMEGKCGEGKCGEGKKDGEGKCGEGKCGEGDKDGEGKCGEGKCGEGDKDAEGKCGEGKCGGDQ
jgi:uncharacterized low-complexity protein